MIKVRFIQPGKWLFLVGFGILLILILILILTIAFWGVIGFAFYKLFCLMTGLC